MDETFMINIEKTGPIQFTTTFDKEFPQLLFDEDKSVGGEDKYPNPSRILVAAVASCLSASLALCLNKARIPVDRLETKATCSIKANEEGYLRITQIDVNIHPKWHSDIKMKKKTRCVKIFKNLCVATNAVINEVPVNVDVQIEGN
ncbi:MAG: OsmC family protein [Candidatus Heimdallarchaeota archaeon]|nr:MAG: OsmC family protein [Candidatus Heimdallarchaeota archaeon]